MNIFITGATGFFGGNLINRLLDEGHSVTALILPNESMPKRTNLTTVHGDITDPFSLRNTMAGCQVLIHAAGAVGYGNGWDLCRRVNINGTANVMAEAQQSGVNRIIHLSSVSVYGRPAGVVVDENFPQRKIGDCYGDTKIEAEKIVNNYTKSYGLQTTILRPTVFYGPGDGKFLPSLINRVKKGQMYIVGDGKNRVNVMHVNDVVEAVMLSLGDPKSIGSVYNVSDIDDLTWEELVMLISNKLGSPKIAKKVPYTMAYAAAWAAELLVGENSELSRYSVRIAGREYNYSSEKIRAELGFRTKHTLRDYIREMTLPEPVGSQLQMR